MLDRISNQMMMLVGDYILAVLVSAHVDVVVVDDDDDDDDDDENMIVDDTGSDD
jgi:hypothetical protein